MNRAFTMFLPLLGLFAAASCAFTPAEETPAAVSLPTTPAARGAPGTVPAVSLVPQSGIGPQTLQSKECALFLWSQTDPTQFIFFQKAGSGVARLRIGDATVDAPQTANRGTIFGQFMTEQGFAAPGGEKVLLTVVPGDDLQGGQRIQSGLMTITSTEGWRTLIPVLGVRACEN